MLNSLPVNNRGEVLGVLLDDHVRCTYTISSGNRFFEAGLLIDTGASTELFLPARKVIQLNLRPYMDEGDIRRSKGYNNISADVYDLYPEVYVKVVLDRGGEEVVRSARLKCSVFKDEYDREKAHPSPAPAASREVELEDEKTEFNPVPAATPRPRFRLSPVKHRFDESRVDYVILGHGGIQKVGLKIDATERWLEVAEEVPVEGTFDE